MSTTTTQIPTGLIAAFAMINPEGATTIAARRSAEQAIEPANRIIDALYGLTPSRTFQDVEIADILKAATVAEHQQVYPNPWSEPQLASDTSFRVGFAVCWLLMTQINGGTR